MLAGLRAEGQAESVVLWALGKDARTLAALRDALIASGGPWAEALGRERAVRVSLNQTMADESAALADGPEVAFFPPVTGG